MRRAPLLAALALAACATAGPRPVPPAAGDGRAEAIPRPAPVPAAAVAVPEPRIALVLGGGAARGFAHVGVIRVLEQEKIPIDLVVGTSVGSLIGAIYASTRDSFELEWTAFQLQREDLFDFGIMNAVMGMGYAKGEKLEAFVRSKVKQENVEQLPIPFAAVATDLNWGTRVVLDKGSIAKAVRASSAIPGVFEPVQHVGKLLVDGGVVDNIPIDVAREKGADLVIAVDISENVGNTDIKNVLDVMMQAANIMFEVNVQRQKRAADVLVTPAVGDVGTLDFSQKKRCMQAGIDAARKALPQIREAIDAWKARKAAALQGRS